MKKSLITKALSVIAIGLTAVVAEPAWARYDMELGVSFNGVMSSGPYAPYMIGSWSEGRNMMRSEAYADLFARRDLDSTRRFSYGFGLEVMAGYMDDIVYKRYEPSTKTLSGRSVWRPGAVRLQQLYGTIKYRSLEFTAGARNYGSVLLDDRLSSGDVVRGINTRPIPQIQGGLIDFRDIPFTRGWMQVNGALSYGRTFDGSFQRAQANRQASIINAYTYYTYKYIHFRTRPSEPFSVTFGMQAGGMFGGTTRHYDAGMLKEEKRRGLKAGDVIKMLFPVEGNGEDYYEGNTVGSWDFKARYRFKGGYELSAYFEWLFEDGSGVGKLNGFDGLWGLEFKPAGLPWLKGLVVEYLDFTNQSGPIHHSVPTTPGTTLDTDCSGADNYYNNGYYGAYAYYGMSIGSPFMKSPFYNLDGEWMYLYNRTRGFHIGAEGDLLPGVLSYRVKVSAQKGYGNGMWMIKHPLRSGSGFGELTWRGRGGSRGLEVTGALAMDRGGLRGNNFGAMMRVSYSTNLSDLTK